jgi:hypothetical protein
VGNALNSEEEFRLYVLSRDKQAVAQCTKMHTQTLSMMSKGNELISSVKLENPSIHRFDLYVDALNCKKHRFTRTRTLNVFVQRNDCLPNLLQPRQPTKS